MLGRIQKTPEEPLKPERSAALKTRTKTLLSLWLARESHFLETFRLAQSTFRQRLAHQDRIRGFMYFAEVMYRNRLMTKNYLDRLTLPLIMSFAILYLFKRLFVF